MSGNRDGRRAAALAVLAAAVLAGGLPAAFGQAAGERAFTFYFDTSRILSYGAFALESPIGS